jgi:hypothetical protein
MNSKGSSKLEDESSPPPLWQHQTAHQSALNENNCNSWVDCSPSSSLQSQFSTLQLPTFGAPKDAIWGCHFADDDKLNHSVRQELRHFGQEFYVSGMQQLMKRWEKCVDTGDSQHK